MRRVLFFSALALSLSLGSLSTTAQGSGSGGQSLPAQVRPYVSSVWAGISLREAPPRELDIIRSVYGSYLAANRRLVVESAMVDLQGRGVASILVRFSTAAGCVDTAPVCQLALLHFNGAQWDPILTTVGRSVEIERARSATIRGDWGALLKVDGKTVFEPSPRGFYRSTAWGSGTPLVSKVTPQSIPGGARPSDWYVDQVETPQGRLSFYRMSLFLEDQGAELRVFLAPPQNRNRPQGNPVPTMVLETMAQSARVAVRQGTAGAMPEILVDGRDGVVTWTWNPTDRKYKSDGGR